MKRLLFALLLVGCTAPRTAPRTDAVLTGDATAKAAGEAARTAEKEDNTGLLFASSQRKDEAPALPEPTTQPTEPAPTAAVLKIQFVKGTPTMNGEPIADFAGIAAGAVAADPDVMLSITSAEEVDPAKITAITDAAKAAGIKRVMVKILVEEPASAPPAEKPAAP